MASCSPARPGHGGQGRGRAGTDLGPRDPCTEQYNDRDVIFILSAASLAAAGLGHGSLVLSFSLRKLNRNGSEAGLVHEPHIEIPPVNLDNAQAPNPSPVQPTVVTTPSTSSLSSDFQVGFGEQPLMIITIIQVPESSMIDGMIIKLLALKTRSKLMKDPGKPEMSSTDWHAAAASEIQVCCGNYTGRVVTGTRSLAGTRTVTYSDEGRRLAKMAENLLPGN